MPDYYFDTSIWLNYFNQKQFYNKEAKLWFEKIKQGDNILFISPVIGKEIKRKYPDLYLEYEKMIQEFSGLDKIKVITPTKKQYKEIKEIYVLNNEKNASAADITQIVLIRDYNLKGITADITHWPFIAKTLNYNIDISYISDINE